MTVQTILMDASHLSQVLELEDLCFSMPWSRHMMESELNRDNTVYLVARDETGAIWGYAGFYTVLDEGCITNVAVHPDARRKGIGTQLVQALLEAARARGLASITLEVREHNEGALALYRREGFQTVGRRKQYYDKPREDAILMTLSLARTYDHPAERKENRENSGN